MASSGLLIAEVNVNTLCAVDKDAVSLDSMAMETLGPVGARVTGVAYVFIHFALLIAYMLQGGQILLEILPSALLSATGGSLPASVGPPLFATLAGGAVFAGSSRQVEIGNSILFGGVLVSFLALLGVGLPAISAPLLLRSDLGAVLPAVPVIVLSLVYHNVVPTICYQLGCDLGKIRTAILAGSALPALMFVAWNLQLRASGDSFGIAVRCFSLLAVLTSFVGFVLGLVDFFADAFAAPLAKLDGATAAPRENTAALAPAVVDGGGGDAADARSFAQKAVLYAAALAPPLAISTGGDPQLFFSALDNAGTYGILVLFGIVPAAMAWVQRYDEAFGDTAAPDLLPGGRLTLGAMSVGAVAVIAVETYERLAGVAGVA